MAGESASVWQRATQVPVIHSMSFSYDDLDEWLDMGRGRADSHIYGHNTNPTVQAFEEKDRIMENAETATALPAAYRGRTRSYSKKYRHCQNM